MYAKYLVKAVSEISDADIAKIANLLLDCKDRGGKVLLAGNGGASAICSHFTNDLIKCLGIAAVCLTDNIPSLTAYANDNSYDVALGEIANVLVRKNDMIFSMSTSGNSLNVLYLAFKFKLPSVALVGNKGGDMAKWHKHVTYVYAKGFDARSNEDVFSIICHAVVDYITRNPR